MCDSMVNDSVTYNINLSLDKNDAMQVGDNRDIKIPLLIIIGRTPFSA